MKTLIRSICELLSQGEPLVLATVVESSGSTPRSSGAKMVVKRDGSIIGTVGGGLLEAMACKQGLEYLTSGADDGTASLSYVDMTQELAAESDMICGGGVSVLLEVVQPGGPCAEVFHELHSLLRTGCGTGLSTKLEGKESLTAVAHSILTDQELKEEYKLPLLDGAVKFSRDEDSIHLVERFIPPIPLYIFGAGHVSMFTAKAAAMIGFRTVILDDRADFANEERFPDADQVIVLPSFDKCCDSLDIRDDAFIIIVTRGHVHDRNVLAEALRTNARYVGMIGSKKKRDKIYDALRAEGFAQHVIDRCYSPIGLEIGAQTPEEIAIAIAAELIQVRAGA